jgi:hypothetical protein
MFLVPIVVFVVWELIFGLPKEKRRIVVKIKFLIVSMIFNKTLPSLRKNQQKSSQKIINIEFNTIFSMIQLSLQDSENKNIDV